MSRRVIRMLAFALSTAALVTVVLASTASARSHHRFSGVVPDNPSHARLHPPAVATTANLPYGGGVVMHTNRTHLIFWQPAGSGLVFDPGYIALIERFMANVAHDSHLPSNVYGLSGQYHDMSGAAQYASTYGGATIDSDPLPPNGCSELTVDTAPRWTTCLTDAQLETELQKVIGNHHLPTTARDLYFIITPNGFGSCENGAAPGCALGGANDPQSYCGYHSQTSNNSILYAFIPYNGVSGHCQSDNPRPNNNAADPTMSTLSHEHNESVTDPLGTAWIDNSGNEDGDLCFDVYGKNLGRTPSGAYDEVINGGRYYLQEEWSNENRGCRPREATDRVRVSASTRVRAGATVHISGSARAAHGRIVHYDWTFGDGSGGRRDRLTAHRYGRAGRYQVVLRTTNSAGNWAFASRTITVILH